MFLSVILLIAAEFFSVRVCLMACLTDFKWVHNGFRWAGPCLRQSSKVLFFPFISSGYDSMKTYMAATGSVKQRWHLVDASGKTLGRLASALAFRLRGKHKAEFTPHVDTGDFFVVVNADKIKVTGNKAADKKYHRHSGYVGGLKTMSFEQMVAKHPSLILQKAVKGMLPKGPLGRQMLKKLKVYAGAQHPHSAQKPRAVDFDGDK